MIFAPGDEVVCIDDGDMGQLGDWWGKGPVRGRHYTIRGVQRCGDGSAGVLLCEIRHRYQWGARKDRDAAYSVKRFAPVKREAIEIFRAMAASTKPLVEV